MLANTHPSVLLSELPTNVCIPRKLTFVAQRLAYSLLYRRFANNLAAADAPHEADVTRWVFIVVDSHDLLSAGLPAHWLPNLNPELSMTASKTPRPFGPTSPLRFPSHKARIRKDLVHHVPGHDPRVSLTACACCQLRVNLNSGAIRRRRAKHTLPTWTCHDGNQPAR